MITSPRAKLHTEFPTHLSACPAQCAVSGVTVLCTHFTDEETLLVTPPAQTLLRGMQSYPENISMLYLVPNKEFAITHTFKKKMKLRKHQHYQKK